MTPALLALPSRLFVSLRRHRNYRLYFAGQVVSLTGTWMQNVALAWYVVELTHDPVAVGVLAFCRFFPFTVFGLVAGVVADRFDNRRQLMATQAAAMAVSLGLTAMALSGADAVWLAYVFAGLGGTALVFDAPGRHALTFQLVGRDELPNAVALNSSLFNASRVIGPSIAGVVIAAVGVTTCFAINAASFLAVLAALAAMRTEALFPIERRERPTVVRGVREGIAYAWRSPRLRLLLAIILVVATVGFNFHVLVPVLVDETLEAGPGVFGLLSAAFGLGAVVGALAVAALGRASWKALVAGLTLFSSALLLLAPQTTTGSAGVLLFVIGVGFTVWMANAQSILQLTAPDYLRGRMMSLFLFCFGGFAPLGSLLAGWLSDVGGTELAFLVAGGAAAAMTVVVAGSLRRVLRPAHVPT